MVTFVTVPQSAVDLARVPWNPDFLCGIASMLTTHFARTPKGRVLLFTGSRPTIVETSGIRRKPGAIQIVTDVTDWSEIPRRVEKHYRWINSGRAVVSGLVSKFRPVVIINDADFYFSDGAGGSFTRSCDRVYLDRVATIARIVEAAHGDLFIMAVLAHSSDNEWAEIIARRRWTWKQELNPMKIVLDTMKPGRVPKWCHHPIEKPPSEYEFGPLEGTKENLASWLFADRKREYRRLKKQAENGVVWVRAIDRYKCEVFFRNHAKFDAAKSRMLADKIKRR